MIHINNLIASMLLGAILILGACAHKPPRGAIEWDYERNEIGLGSLVIGGVFGGLYSAPKSTIVGGMVANRIALSPDKLQKEMMTVLQNHATPSIHYFKSEKRSSIQRPVKNFGIADVNQGVIITDWKPIEGREAGLLWWKKKYEAQVRHTITIKRSYESSEYTNFSIHTEVRERPNNNYDWSTGDAELGRAEFKKIRNVLLAMVKSLIPAEEEESK